MHCMNSFEMTIFYRQKFAEQWPHLKQEILIHWYLFSSQPCRRSQRRLTGALRTCGVLQCCSGSLSPERCPSLTSQTWKLAWRVRWFYDTGIKSRTKSKQKCRGAWGENAAQLNKNILTLDPRCRWVCFFIGTDLEKCCILSLAHQWILCSEWVPSEWEFKQLLKTSQ